MKLFNYQKNNKNHQSNINNVPKKKKNNKIKIQKQTNIKYKLFSRRRIFVLSLYIYINCTQTRY